MSAFNRRTLSVFNGTAHFFVGLVAFSLLFNPVMAGESPKNTGLIDSVTLEHNPLTLHRPAQPGTPMVLGGRRFALIGNEAGEFEAWAYPVKLLRELRLSFLLGNSTRAIPAREVVRWIDATPEARVLTFVHQDFTIRAICAVAPEEAGAVVLLEVHSATPLSVVCDFLPVLQPMWPAGLGGQYAFWDDTLKAYVISEPSRRHHAFIGCPLGRGISYTPAHMLADTPSEFRIDLPDPKALAGRCIPLIIAGGKGKREDIAALYQRLAADPAKVCRDSVERFRRLERETLRVTTPDRELNLAFAWAKAALDQLVVDNPDLGRGLVAGLGPSGSGGRPGFGWFFGGDASINALGLTAAGNFPTARQALAFQRRWQRADGKIAHELSQAAAYLDWFKDYPYAYLHGDTTPFYILAVHDYYRASGDTAFVKESWDSLQRAYAWCRAADANGDGLMDNAKAGLGALEFGELTGIETDVYLAAVWTKAAEAMTELAVLSGELELANRASADYTRARQAFEDKFWDSTIGYYAYAFDAKGHRVTEVTPWPAVGLQWGLGQGDHAAQALARLSAADMATDWGVRSISKDSRYFEPLNYNYGAVWPFINGWVAAAHFQAHQIPQGYALLAATARHTFTNALGSVTELFAGDRDVWPQEGVPHQGFSSSAVVRPLVRGLLGIDVDSGRKTIRLEPQLPADWTRVTVENLRAGGAVLDFVFTRQAGKFVLEMSSQQAADWDIVFAPAFGAGTRIQGATLNGQVLKLTPAAAGPIVRMPVEFQPRTPTNRVEIRFSPAVEILPPEPTAITGDPDRAMKVVDIHREGLQLKVELEGLAGQAYRLPVSNTAGIVKVEGATLTGDSITVAFTGERPGEFIRKTVVITCRQ